MPTIQRLSRSSPRAELIKALETDGCVVVTDFTTEDKIAQANAEVRPWLEQQDEGHKVGALGGKTRTVTRLLSRSPTVRESFLADPLYHDLTEHFLALETTHWYGAKPLTTTSHPLLSIAITFDVPPGTPAQGLHRDDKNHHWRHTKVDSYRRDRDVLFGLFVPGVDTSRENGATRIVPGSHLWGDEQPEIDEERDVVDASMKKGEALIMLGSLYHGGGAYAKPLTENPEHESRSVFAMFCCNGVSRQEEIPWLVYDSEEVKGWSDAVKLRLGWKWSEPNLGWVDLMSPDVYFDKTLGK